MITSDLTASSAIASRRRTFWLISQTEVGIGLGSMTDVLEGSRPCKNPKIWDVRRNSRYSGLVESPLTLMRMRFSLVR